MRNTLSMLGSIAVTILGFGLYGPTLRTGQLGMSTVGGAAVLRPFVCVGLAYFLIGIVVPTIWLHLRGEKGAWTLSGIGWSIAGGALGAIGAFSIILAYKFGGHPVWVMPLVFGGAPAVNAFLTVVMAGKLKEIGPWFLAGLIIVVLGVVVIALTRPYAHPPAAAQAAAPAAKAEAPPAATPTPARSSGGFMTLMYQFLAIASAILSWGAYGPVLHKGQAAMYHSRMRPFICVGLAYLAIAVIIPYFFLGEIGEASSYLRMGALWSLLAGTFAACGALGIIMAFNFGGKPIFVMPLVFGGAPVISTLTSVTMERQWGNVNPLFWAGLILIIAGAVMVLVLAPRGDAPKPAKAPA